MNPEKFFYLKDGGILKNLFDMGMKLDGVAKHVFQHHVNAHRNDFATWIEFVYKDKKLAEKLRSTNDQCKTQVIVLKHLLKQHKTKKIKKFKCNVCGKGFTTRVGLSVHKTIAHKRGDLNGA